MCGKDIPDSYTYGDLQCCRISYLYILDTDLFMSPAVTIGRKLGIIIMPLEPTRT